MAVFRIIQEALSNVARHAGAQRVAVCLECRPACIVATVSDDGCGFDLANRSGPAGLPVHADFAAAHFGLSIMNERARLFSGELTVDSRPSEGTTVRVSIPLSEGMTADDHGLNR
jgi:signal transduction histidine kinase